MIKKIILSTIFISFSLFAQSNIEYIKFSGNRFNITSSEKNVIIFIDSTKYESLPKENMFLETGRHIIKVIHNFMRWNTKTIEKFIEIVGSDSFKINNLHFDFRKKNIYSTPENCKVLLNNIFIGNTPLEFFASGNDTLEITKEGFHKIKVVLDTNSIINLVLKKDTNIVSKRENEQVKILNGDHLYYYLIGGGLVSGTLSVLAKNKADNLENNYWQDPNSQLKNKIRTYDFLSGAAILVFESCFLVLSYLLLNN